MKTLKCLVFIQILACFFVQGSSEQKMQFSGAQYSDTTNVVNNQFSFNFSLSSSSTLVKIILPLETNVDNIKFILSDGTVVDSSNYAQSGIEVQQFIPSQPEDLLISITKAVLVTFENTLQGNTVISGDVVGSIPESLSFDVSYINSPVTFGVTYYPDSLIYPNDEITFGYWIRELNLTPENVAIVNLKIIQSGQVLNSYIMLDDGNLRDFEANDGFYTKSFTLLNSGRYTIQIDSEIVAKDGHTYKNSVIETIEISPPPSFDLTEPFTEELIDSNNNGYADILKLTYPLTTLIPAGKVYSVQIDIGSDTELYDHKRVKIDERTTEVSFEFSGLKIGEKHVSGPIKIRSFRIKDLTDGMKLIVSREFNTETSSYVKSQFERANEVIVQNEADVTFVDGNNDKIYEGINFAFRVDVLTDGKYQGRGRLKDALGTEVQGDIDIPLVAGIYDLNLFIPAKDIIESSINGIADFVWFKFYRYDDIDWQMVERSKFGTTPLIVCWDFGDCSSQGLNTVPIAEDDSYQGIESFEKVELDVLSNDSDNDSDDIIVNGFSTPSNGSIVTDENNLFFYIANPGFSGLDNFSYTINDFYPPNGIAKGGESTANVQVNIRSNTQANIGGDSYIVTMDQSTILDVLSNDSDADGDTLFFTSIDQPANGQAEIINDKVTYTPNLGFSGADNFTYYVKEKDEATGLIGTTTYGAGVVINVIPPNQAPIAVADTASLYIDEQLDIDVLANVNVDEVGDVVLDAADITDIDGDISTWHWEYLSGPYISFLSPNEATSDAWIGSTDGNSISTVRLTVSDLAGNQSTSVISLNIKETITNNDNSAPLTSSSVKIWGGKTKYKNATLSVNETPVLTYWKYSGEDLFNGGGYVKDKWYLYDSEISFKLVGAGGRMYYYSVDRSGNIETEQSVKIGGKGK